MSFRRPWPGGPGAACRAALIGAGALLLSTPTAARAVNVFVLAETSQVIVQGTVRDVTSYKDGAFQVFNIGASSCGVYGTPADYLRGIGPRALVVDDVHEADPTDREFLAVLLRRIDPAQLTVVITTGTGPLTEPTGPIAVPLEPALETYCVRVDGAELLLTCMHQRDLRTRRLRRIVRSDVCVGNDVPGRHVQTGLRRRDLRDGGDLLDVRGRLLLRDQLVREWPVLRGAEMRRRLGVRLGNGVRGHRRLWSLHQRNELLQSQLRTLLGPRPGCRRSAELCAAAGHGDGW